MTFLEASMGQLKVPSYFHALKEAKCIYNHIYNHIFHFDIVDLFSRL